MCIRLNIILFINLLGEWFNAGITYKDRNLKRDTVIEQKTTELVDVVLHIHFTCSYAVATFNVTVKDWFPFFFVLLTL